MGKNQNKKLLLLYKKEILVFNITKYFYFLKRNNLGHLYIRLYSYRILFAYTDQ